MSDPIEQFIGAIAAAGVTAPRTILPDGKLHRFASNGDARDKAGWYVFHPDGLPAGAFGDFRSGLDQTWRADIDRKLSPQELADCKARVEHMRRQREAEAAKVKAEARKKAVGIWDAADPAPDVHPYLGKKGVKSHGLRVHEDRLVVPMRDDQGTLHSLQFIAADGVKSFLPGGRVEGCFYQIGEPRGVTCVGEGYATMATVHEITGHAAVATFNRSSLLAVAQSFRSRFPAAKIILCADDDWKVKGNPGLTDARAAAAAVGGVVAVPEFGEGRGKKDTDFNDMARGAVLDRIEKALGGKPVDALDSQPNDKTAPESTKKPKAPRAPSEDDLALDFADRYADELRYVSFWGKWLKWTAGRWQVEKTLAAYDLARKICHGHSLGGLRARTIAAIETMARWDRRLAATTDQLDADPLLFNTPAGTVELLTGNLREHRPQDYIMKIAGCSPGAEGCPMFFEFLNTIFAKDYDLINYLQKFFGYILTGLTIEHAMLFFHGAGANGKSVLVSTIAGILGEYHRVAPIDTFTATGFSRHSTDLAGLIGARLVTAHETEEGAKWAEAKLKALTGGDKITAQFMRQDYFDYLPAFKLAITGNHKPGLQSVDEAMRRRLNLIPFNVTIPKADRDPSLAEKLKTEWPGILAWMIDGCLLWQKEGRLNPPQAVITATGEYLESEDAIATWIVDRCELKASYEDTAAELFKSWKAWAELMREPAGSAKAFGNKLQARPGIKPKAIGHSNARGYSGIHVVKVEEAEPEQSSFYRDD